jgi:hypothetical protein
MKLKEGLVPPYLNVHEHPKSIGGNSAKLEFFSRYSSHNLYGQPLENTTSASYCR